MKNPDAVNVGALEEDQLGGMITSQDSPVQHTIQSTRTEQDWKRALLHALRCALLRVRLLETELATVECALKSGWIDAGIGERWLGDFDALALVVELIEIVVQVPGSSRAFDD